MNSAVFIPGIDPRLQEIIEEKIAIIRASEHLLPCVIIIHDITDGTVKYMSESGLSQLKVSLEQLQQMGPEYYNRYFNPEDAKDYVPKILTLLEKNNSEESISYFQQVRLAEHHDWTWHLSSTRIFLHDLEGKPYLTITTSIPVDAKHHVATKLERLLQENNFLRKNQETFSQLSKREKELLKLLALGMNTSEIAKLLHLSELTVSTHRRNIKAKLNAQSNYDFTVFAQAFNLI